MQADSKNLQFLQKNSPDGGFLQSPNWFDFQQKVGRRVHFVAKENFVANVIEHELPIVGKYFYVPRGPIAGIMNHESGIKENLENLVSLAKNENTGWIRIEPANTEILEAIKKECSTKIIKAPHDMQPKEIFALDITKSQEQLLSEMKAKTRYNINLAKKKGVEIIADQKREYVEEFLRLTKEMAARQGIATHADEYYRKMIETLPSEMLRIYVAKYEGKVIVANLVLFFGEFATYLHGASSNEHRNVMAPFLVQWQAILDAKEHGCKQYDFGGVKTKNNDQRSRNNWEGITNFKLGFSPQTKPMVFPGSYDIVINPRKYAVYRGLQKAKAFAVKFRR